MKITTITELSGRMYAHVCPICGKIIASATEKDMMPEYSICSCEQAKWKYISFNQYGSGEEVTMVLHQTTPEFGFIVTANGELIDTSDNHWDSEEQCEEWMRKANMYIEGREPIQE